MERALATSRAAIGHGRRTAPPIRLMIVDDSMVARAVLSRMIEADGDFEIAAVAGTAEDAIDALGQVRVDIILLDLEMPGAGGLEVDSRGSSRPRSGAQVLIVSSLAEEGAEETVAALALGAADTLPKPGTGRFNGRFSEVLLGKLRALGCADGQRRRRAVAAPLRRLGAAARRCRRDPLGCSRSAPRPAASMRSAASSQALPRADRRADPGHPASAGAVHDRLRAPAGASPPGREAVVAEDGMRAAARPDRHRAGRRASDRRRCPAAAWSPGCSQPKVVERLPAVGRPDAGLGRRGARRRRARRRPDRHGPRRRSKAPRAGRRAAARSWPRTRPARRSGACRARSPKRAWPAPSCRPTSSRAGSPLAPRRPRASKRQLQPDPRRPARSAHRPATDDEPPLADRDRACRRCCASAASPRSTS